MLAYSIHLGNDKNKTKKAKEIAKNNTWLYAGNKQF